MRTLAGPGAHIHFTSLSKLSAAFLSREFQQNSEPLANVQCYQQGILDLIKSRGVSLDRVCLLDPKAERGLSPEDGGERFDWFLFGVRRPSPLSLSLTKVRRPTRSSVGNSRCFIFSVSQIKWEIEARNYR